MIENILKVSKLVKNNRNINKVFIKLIEEIGELGQEINILDGFVKPEKGGEDGIIGEAIDCIINLIDLIYLYNPDISENEITEILNNKLGKWMLGVNKTKNMVNDEAVS